MTELPGDGNRIGKPGFRKHASLPIWNDYGGPFWEG
jgi:hypothetical protein